MPLVVNAFWIFSQSQLHGRRCLDHHGVHPLSGGLNGGELTGDGVGGARPGEYGGDTGLTGLLKTPVQRIDRVYGPEVGGTGVGSLVPVVGLKAQGVTEHPQMTMGVNKAGQDMALACVQGLSLPVVGALLHRPHLGNLVPRHGHISVGDG